MGEERRKSPSPPRTRSIEVGHLLPEANVAGLYVGGQPLPDEIVAELHVEAGPGVGTSVAVTRPVTVLGRGAAYADVEIGDESTSRRHAFIAYREGGFSLADMGSTNGTKLNGKLVGEATLTSGDRIQIGASVLRFAVSKRR